MKRLRGYRIQRLAQNTVGGNFVNRKHGFQVARLHSILHPPLEGQQGGILKKHHCQRTHEAVVQREIDLTRLSRIVDLLEKLRESPSKCIEAQMFFDMHSDPIPIDNLLECIAIYKGAV